MQREPPLVEGVDELVGGGRDRGQDPEPPEGVLAFELAEHAGRDGRARHTPWKPSHPATTVADELVVAPLVAEGDRRRSPVTSCGSTALGLEEDRAARGRAGPR